VENDDTTAVGTETDQQIAIQLVDMPADEGKTMRFNRGRQTEAQAVGQLMPQLQVSHH
jgi:hypothetical protein